MPTEKQEQKALFAWADRVKGKYPELSLMYSIPNAGGFTGGFQKNLLRVLSLRAEGVKKGVPDICLPVARGGFHSLYIEMKRVKGGKEKPEQAEWRIALATAGHQVVTARGVNEGIKALEKYLAHHSSP